jgi:Outer membrane efflux protein
MFCVSKKSLFPCWALVLCLVVLTNSALAESRVKSEQHATELSLSEVLRRVKANDLSLARFEIDAQAYIEESDANSYLPDPVLFAGAANLPTDTFAFDQEPMTQLRFGLRQMFPKGDSLEIQKDMSLINSDIEHIKQKLRWKNLKLETETYWLEAWYWQKNQALLEEDRAVLTQLQDFIQSLYQVGSKSQTELLSAKLEIIKLDESLIEAEQEFRKYKQQLNTIANESLPNAPLASKMTKIKLASVNLDDIETLTARLVKHPEVMLLDEQVGLFKKKVSLAEQSFGPTWGVEVAYGLRDGENMDGSDRPDFFSAGVSVQLPLFTRGKQTKEVSAAKIKQDSVLNRRTELVQKIRFELENIHEQHLLVVKQRRLYEQEIMPNLAEQRESTLSNYESDKADFRSVTEVLLREQKTKLKHQRLRVKEQLMLAQMNYWLALDSEPSQKKEAKQDTKIGEQNL